jgi:hypothetical protein
LDGSRGKEWAEDTNDCIVSCNKMRERERERGERGEREREREREREPCSSLKSGEIGVIAQKLSPVPLDEKMCVHFIKIVYFFAQA